MKVIDASKLMLKELPDGNYLVTKEAMHNAPTFEAEPVIYCKNCLHYTYGYCREIRYIMDGYYRNTFEVKNPNDFCSRAEPKEEV